MKKLFILFILISTFLTSCSSSISNIRDNPSDYNGKVVSFSGDVIETFSLPATGITIYLLYDRTGKVPVLTTKKRKMGDYVRIRATVFAVESRGIANNIEIVIEKIIEYLKDNDIIKGRFVEIAAKGLAKVLKIVLAKSDGTFILVE